MLDSVLLLFSMGGSEWILIVVVVLVLFGGKKIPELMRGMGRGVKEFKDGISGNDNTATKEESNNTKIEK
ncbi:MAG: twin-arginine translocase TatA/TatE family subunit [Bacteroidales bacterium]|nr:twin-arginine translocase TatA/TatE family subunit [Bacteroidales bacterium]